MEEQNRNIVESNPYSTYGLVAFIYSVIDKFPAIKDYVASSNINTATLFIPQNLSYLDGEVTRNPALIHDAYLILDMVNLYSFEVYSNYNQVKDSLIESIVDTRYVEAADYLFSEEAMDPYTIGDPEQFKKLISNNKILLAVYVYLLTVSVM